MSDKRTVYVISSPQPELACIAAQLLFEKAGDLYDIRFDGDTCSGPQCCEALEKLGYFGYTFVEPSYVDEPAYDYVIDINCAMYQLNKHKQAYQKCVYWQVDHDQEATEQLQRHISYFTSRFNITL